MSAADFSLKRFHYLGSKEGHIKSRTTSSPSYELNQEGIDQINNILIELFPNHYYQASFAKSEYEKPKEESLNAKNPEFIKIAGKLQNRKEFDGMKT